MFLTHPQESIEIARHMSGSIMYQVHVFRLPLSNGPAGYNLDSSQEYPGSYNIYFNISNILKVTLVYHNLVASASFIVTNQSPHLGDCEITNFSW